MTPKQLERVNEYIKQTWSKTVRTAAGEDRINLPYPVSVPCETQRFTYFFYWDTYFINLGLLEDDPAQALNNVRNMKFLVEQLGFIPNGNLKCMLNRSQPPLYISAVCDYFEKFPSAEIAREFYPTMAKEYEFWMTRRLTPCGLNRYASHATESEVTDFIDEISDRGIIDSAAPDVRERALHLFAEAESGWDFCPRFGGKALDYAPADLNAILYKNEVALSRFAQMLGKEEESARYAAAAEIRRARMDALMRDEEGVYRDYDFVTGKRSEVVSTASLVPYWAGVSEDGAGCAKALGRLEQIYGISACEENVSEVLFQWDYPNMWPPLVGFSVVALEKAGAREDAARIAAKYMDAVALTYEEEGYLCEKYCSLTGRCSNHNEYDPPRMLGWTAGVFRSLCEKYLRGKE